MHGVRESTYAVVVVELKIVDPIPIGWEQGT